jgi:predicted DNA repair protein MutK
VSAVARLRERAMLVFKVAIDCGVRTLENAAESGLVITKVKVLRRTSGVDGSPSLDTKTKTVDQGLGKGLVSQVPIQSKGVRRTIVPVRKFPGTVTGTLAQS